MKVSTWKWEFRLVDDNMDTSVSIPEDQQDSVSGVGGQHGHSQTDQKYFKDYQVCDMFSLLTPAKSNDLSS